MMWWMELILPGRRGSLLPSLIISSFILSRWKRAPSSWKVDTVFSPLMRSSHRHRGQRKVRIGLQRCYLHLTTYTQWPSAPLCPLCERLRHTAGQIFPFFFFFSSVNKQAAVWRATRLQVPSLFRALGFESRLWLLYHLSNPGVAGSQSLHRGPVASRSSNAYRDRRPLTIRAGTRLGQPCTEIRHSKLYSGKFTPMEIITRGSVEVNLSS